MKPSSLNTHTKRELDLGDNGHAQQLFGELNQHLLTIEKTAEVTISVRGNLLQISGRKHAVDLAISTLEQLAGLVRKGLTIFDQDVSFAVNILAASPKASLEEIFLDKICITSRKRIISPKSLNQKHYIEAIRSHDIVFGIGPAGTGKTSPWPWLWRALPRRRWQKLF